MRSPVRVFALTLCLLLSAILVGCGGHALKPPPPSGAAFVGADVCRQCHSTVHAQWSTTLHAQALSALQNIGQGTNTACIPCHVVGFGQPTGFTTLQQTPNLANVQCENCHGPGGKHVLDPSGVPMQVSLAADLCGQCHRGPNHPNFEQWSSSKHAQALQVLQGLPFATPDCYVCHSVEIFLGGSNPTVRPHQAPPGAKNPITCQLCHEAHGSPNPKQLRRPIQDTCTVCHTDGGILLPSGQPHHPQKEMLAGTGGFKANGSPAHGPNSPHTNAVSEKCVLCHVFQVPVPQPTPENPVNTGHTFLPLVPLACRQCHPGNQSVQFKKFVQAQIAQQEGQIAPYFTPGSPQYIDPGTLTPPQLAQYNIAQFDYLLVTGDLSQGVHNTAYAQYLLGVSLTILQSL